MASTFSGNDVQTKENRILTAFFWGHDCRCWMGNMQIQLSVIGLPDDDWHKFRSIQIAAIDLSICKALANSRKMFLTDLRKLLNGREVSLGTLSIHIPGE